MSLSPALLPALDTFLEAAREAERQKIILPLENRLERAMMRAFKAQGRRFLRMFGNLRKFFTETALLEDATESDWAPLFTAAELATIRLFLEPMTVLQRLALASGARAALADVNLGLSFDLADPAAVAYIEDAPLRIAGINETTREQVRRVLSKGVEEGWSYDKTAKELQALYEGFSTPQPQLHIRSRAHLIAVTETGDAYAKGHMIVGQQLQNAGLPMQKRWLDTGDERECPICAGNASDGWIPFDQQFRNGQDAPTAHPSCRCDIEQRAAV